MVARSQQGDQSDTAAAQLRHERAREMFVRRDIRCGLAVKNTSVKEDAALHHRSDNYEERTDAND